MNDFENLPSTGTHHLRSPFASGAFNPVAVDSFQFLVEANFHLGVSKHYQNQMNHARTSPLLCKPAHQFFHSLCGGECLPQPEQHSTLHSRVACGDSYISKYFYIAYSAFIFVLLSRVANVDFHVNLKFFQA